MSLAIIPFLLGKHLTSVVILPQTLGDDGGLTLADTQSVTAQVKVFNINPTVETDDGRGVNSEYANAMPHSYDGTLDLTLLLRRDQNVALRDAWTYDHHVIEATLASGEVMTFYGVRVGAPVDISSHGTNTFRVSYKQFAPYSGGEPVEPITITSGS